jgi:hypothetical protein
MSKPICVCKVVRAKSYLLVIVFSKYLVHMFFARTQIVHDPIIQHVRKYLEPMIFALLALLALSVSTTTAVIISQSYN